MNTRELSSQLGLKDTGKVPVVSKLVDQLFAKQIISGEEHRILSTLKSNQEAWTNLLKIVDKSKCMSAFHDVLLQTDYKDIVALPKIPDNPKRKKSLFDF